MTDNLWWREGIIYQIYPRSFFDANGDGIGDLPGITSHLDYLADLGIDAIWLSPFYPTPDADFGYDISNHTDVDPRFGTLADFETLTKEAHRRHIRLILDLALNHTSDQHPWFVESRSSRNNPKRNWYIWRDAARAGKPPNHWQSCFGGRAWEYDAATQQYYYHMFLKEQPDVNWHNAQVRKAQLDVVRFWLERDVDGFRLDVFNAYFKDDRFRDNPAKFGLRAFDRQRHIYDCDRPEMADLLHELRGILDAYPERYAVGETFLATPKKAAGYCGSDRLHAAFNFGFTEQLTQRLYHPAFFLRTVQKWDAVGAGIWPNYVLSNHDLPRTATRYACGESDERVKVMMALLLTLRGTPFLYYGEEIGMRNIHLSRKQIMDPPGKRYWPLYKGRDVCRSPMQWDATTHAGFTSGKPWLPVHPNYPLRNIAMQREDPDSIFNLTRLLIALRRENPALRRGTFLALTPTPCQILAYLRYVPEQAILVALNFSRLPASARLNTTHAEENAPILDARWRLIFSSHRNEPPDLSRGVIRLEANEICLLATP